MPESSWNPRVCAQLYSVRDPMAADPRATLLALRDAGYDSVELTMEDIEPQDYAALLKEVGLDAVSAHGWFDDLEGELPELELLAAVGAPQVVCGSCPSEFLTVPAPAEDWVAAGRRMEPWAQEYARRGIRFAYHDHEWELEAEFGERRGLDLLLEGMPSADVELDVAWIAAGGADPVQYIHRYADRLSVLHIKDVRRRADAPASGGGRWDIWETVELGAGQVDLDAALEAARAVGVPILAIEQDHSPDQLGSALRSLSWLLGRLGRA